MGLCFVSVSIRPVTLCKFKIILLISTRNQQNVCEMRKKKLRKLNREVKNISKSIAPLLVYVI